MTLPDGSDDRLPSAQAYGAFFGSLSLESLSGLRTLCHPDVIFKDPFNETQGVEAFIKVMAHGLSDLHEPRFHITDVAVGGEACYLRWVMTFRRSPRGAPWELAGVSEVHFDGNGKVTRHIDHWDAAGQLYERLPMLGTLISWVRRRLTVSI